MVIKQTISPPFLLEERIYETTNLLHSTHTLSRLSSSPSLLKPIPVHPIYKLYLYQAMPFKGQYSLPEGEPGLLVQESTDSTRPLNHLLSSATITYNIVRFIFFPVTFKSVFSLDNAYLKLLVFRPGNY